MTPDEARGLEHMPPTPGGDKLILQAGQGAPPVPAPNDGSPQ